MINTFKRLMLLTNESKNGVEDTLSNSGSTTTNATICLLQGFKGWILCEGKKKKSRGMWELQEKKMQKLYEGL